MNSRKGPRVFLEKSPQWQSALLRSLIHSVNIYRLLMVCQTLCGAWERSSSLANILLGNREVIGLLKYAAKAKCLAGIIFQKANIIKQRGCKNIHRAN